MILKNIDFISNPGRTLGNSFIMLNTEKRPMREPSIHPAFPNKLYLRVTKYLIN